MESGCAVLAFVKHKTCTTIAFLSNMRCSWQNRALAKQGIGRVRYFPENRYIAQQSYLNAPFSFFPCCSLQSKNRSQSRFPLQRNSSQSLANEV